MRNFESRVKRTFQGDPEEDYAMDLFGAEDNEEAGLTDYELLVKGSITCIPRKAGKMLTASTLNLDPP